MSKSSPGLQKLSPAAFFRGIDVSMQANALARNRDEQLEAVIDADNFFSKAAKKMSR